MKGYRWVVLAQALATAIALAVALEWDTDVRDANVEVTAGDTTAVPGEAADVQELSQSEVVVPPQQTNLIDEHGMLAAKELREIANSDRYETLLQTLAAAPDGRYVRSYLHPRILNVVHDFGGTVVMTAFECGKTLCTLSFTAPDEITAFSFVLALGEEERFYKQLHAMDVFTIRGHQRRVFFSVTDGYPPD